MPVLVQASFESQPTTAQAVDALRAALDVRVPQSLSYVFLPLIVKVTRARKEKLVSETKVATVRSLVGQNPCIVSLWRGIWEDEVVKIEEFVLTKLTSPRWKVVSHRNVSVACGCWNFWSCHIVKNLHYIIDRRSRITYFSYWTDIIWLQ